MTSAEFDLVSHTALKCGLTSHYFLIAANKFGISWVSRITSRMLIRELHGDRFILYPSPTVLGTLIPISTPIPATSFKIVPVPIHPHKQLSPPHPISVND